MLPGPAGGKAPAGKAGKRPPTKAKGKVAPASTLPACNSIWRAAQQEQMGTTAACSFSDSEVRGKVVALLDVLGGAGRCRKGMKLMQPVIGAIKSDL